MKSNGDIAFSSSREEWFTIFNITNVEELTKFATKINTDKDTEKRNINCRLWSNYNNYIYALCKLEKNLPLGDNKINIDQTSFTFGDYNIIVNFENIKDTTIKQYNSNIPILYSFPQKIVYTNDKEYFDVKFKVDSYKNDPLIFYEETMINFENCKYIDTNKNDLNCQISKAQIEQRMFIIDEKHKVNIVNYDKGFITQNLVGSIEMEYQDTIEKKDIYVGITHLSDYISSGIVYYETNVTNISNIKTSSFKFNIEEPIALKYYCQFIGGNNKLIFACFPRYSEEGMYFLGNITQEKKENVSNIKYNFLIQPTFNNEGFVYKSDDNYLYSVYPEVLDFSSKDSLYIIYGSKNPQNIQNITLNPDGPNLECNVIGGESITCLVPKSHFDGKTDGYYYAHHLNYKNKITISYFIPPIKVILTKTTPSPDNSNSFGTSIFVNQNSKRILQSKIIENAKNNIRNLLLKSSLTMTSRSYLKENGNTIEAGDYVLIDCDNEWYICYDTGTDTQLQGKFAGRAKTIGLYGLKGDVVNSDSSVVTDKNYSGGRYVCMFVLDLDN